MILNLKKNIVQALSIGKNRSCESFAEKSIET